MSKVRNIVMICVVACVLLCTGVLSLLNGAGIIERPSRSYLEGKDYQVAPAPTFEAVTSGSFQDEFEAFLADAVPQRDDVMLTNALAQRNVIRLANAPFGFEVYPTFLGSEYLCWPEAGTVTWMPYTQSEELEQQYQQAADLCSGLAARYPQTRWFFSMPDRGECTSALPYIKHLSNAANYDYIQKIFLDKLQGIRVIGGNAYYDTDQYLADYYLTDHHWNIDGALKYYNRVADAMGHPQISFDESHRIYPNTFWGSQARSGLAIEGPGDVARDVFYDLSHLKVKVNGEERTPEALNMGALDPNATYPVYGPFDSVRANWLHYDYGIMEVENPNVESGSLLIVRDSFGSDLERFFTDHYHRVVIVDLRRLDGSFKDIMEAERFDDALFMQAFYTPVDQGQINHLSEWNNGGVVSSGAKQAR